ncbi:MAG: ABC transporter substrate-binding protein [Leptotrichiaceae bacterium]|nr:ABC transporter substrate-binding protein [Leptotrichiaceae bacterium]
MKKIISILTLLAASILIVGCANKKEEAKTEKVYKIGVSQIVEHPALDDAKKGFEDAIKKSGLKVEFDDKNANKDMSAQTMIMQQFKNDKKDLVFAISTPTAQAAMAQIDPATPIVFASVSDPAGAGLVGKSNITGTSGAPEIESNLKLIKEAFPNAKKIGVLYNTSEQNSVVQVKMLKELAPKYGFEVIAESSTNANEMVSALAKISKEIDVFYAIQDSTLVTYFKNLSEKMNEQKIPIIGSNEVYTNLGGLISQGTTDYQIGYRAGEMAVEILKNGKKPSDIKIESVQMPTISINKANMELLGIKLPESVLSKAKIK